MKHRIDCNNRRVIPKPQIDSKGKKTEVISTKISSSVACKEIILCFVFMGEDLLVTFRKEVSVPEGYQEIDETVAKARKQLLRVYYPQFKNRRNIHIGRHFRSEAELSATNVNLEVSVKEKRHKIPKDVAAHSNKVDLTRDMMVDESNRMVLRHLLDGGCFRDVRAGPKLLAMQTDDTLSFLFHGLALKSHLSQSTLQHPRTFQT